VSDDVLYRFYSYFGLGSISKGISGFIPCRTSWKKERQLLNIECINYYIVNLKGDSFTCEPEAVLKDLIQIDIKFRNDKSLPISNELTYKVKVWTDYTTNGDNSRLKCASISKGNMKIGLRLINALSQSSCSKNSLIIINARPKDEKDTIEESNTQFKQLQTLATSRVKTKDILNYTTRMIGVHILTPLIAWTMDSFASYVIVIGRSAIYMKICINIRHVG
jgi:hypothetical protein